MNQITLLGGLTKDPQLRTTSTGNQITNFDLAVKRNRPNSNGEFETDYFTIITFGKLAENCNKYLKKGSKALVSGSVQNRSYEAKDGTKKYITEVIANEVEFIGGFGQGTQKTDAQPTAVQQEMTPIDVDDQSLPF